MDGIWGAPDDSGRQFQTATSGHSYPVGENWEAIDPKIIIKSFRKCSIYNNIHGTEDDFLWNGHDDEHEMRSFVSDDDKLYDDVLTDAQVFCQTFEDDRDSEFRTYE